MRVKDRRALITGVTGQDGAYLAQLLLEEGWSVIGAVRRSSTSNMWRLQELGIADKVQLIPFDLLEFGNILRTLQEYRPERIFNLGAQSFVATSFEQPLLTADVDAMGCLRLLEAIRMVAPETRFYQASTSEMFGKVREVPQTELTPFHPRSPYGVAKLFAHAITVNYRESYNMHASCGILFNHESPLRGMEFVTRKITSHLALLRRGVIENIALGNLDAERDWGHARDYTRGMHYMLERDKPDDFVLATGVKTTVREFAHLAAQAAGYDIVFEGKGIEEVGYDRVRRKPVFVVDPKYFRPAEVELLTGDPAKARRELDWHTEISVAQLAEEMVRADLDRTARGMQLC